jgi:hypothetical protein
VPGILGCTSVSYSAELCLRKAGALAGFDQDSDPQYDDCDRGGADGACDFAALLLDTQQDGLEVVVLWEAMSVVSSL